MELLKSAAHSGALGCTRDIIREPMVVVKHLLDPAMESLITRVVHLLLPMYIITCGLYYKCLTIITYDRNDSGQYYKTTIVVKASLS